MASAPLADPATLLSWLGLPNDPALEERAGVVIGVISDLVRGEARQDTWTLTSVPGAVSAVVLMVSAACFGNPDSKTSVTVEEVTRRWERGDLFSSSQLDTIRGHRPNSTGGLSTIQYGPSWIPTPIYTPVVGGEPVRLYDGRGY